jgi:hypothetical protein
MTNKLDVLQSLYNATISTNPDTYKIEITDSKIIKIKEPDLTIEDEGIRNRKIEFTIKENITNDFRYVINIYKVPYTFFWFNIDKYLKYYAVIFVYKKPTPGYSSISSYATFKITYDSSKDGGRDLAERLFNYIVDTDTKIKEKIESDKIEIYNKDLKKLASKSVAREDKLDKILNDKS